jgi:hypothetical protein
MITDTTSLRFAYRRCERRVGILTQIEDWRCASSVGKTPRGDLAEPTRLSKVSSKAEVRFRPTGKSLYVKVSARIVSGLPTITKPLARRMLRVSIHPLYRKIEPLRRVPSRIRIGSGMEGFDPAQHR